MFSSPEQRLLMYGLVGAFDSIAMMHDEDTAIILSKAIDASNDVCNNESSDDDSDPDLSELVDESEILTYFELQLSVEEVSAQLYHRLGVRAGDRVLLLCQSHAPAEVVSCLSCVKLGAPFVPIDHTWISAGRLESIIADAAPVAAIVVGANDSDPVVLALAKVGVYRCVLVNPDGTLVASEANSCDIRKDIPRLIDPDYDEDEGLHDAVIPSGVLDSLPPLYILYTSGSTGTPKGVLGTHRGLMNRLVWQYKRFPFILGGGGYFGGEDGEDGEDEEEVEREVVCRRTPLTFVDALVEIFAPLLATVPIWVPPQDIIRQEGIAAIIPAAAAAGVSRITMLPIQLATTLRLVPNIGELWPCLKMVVVSGEPCLATLARQFSTAIPNCQLVNLYGSTEVAGDVTYAVICSPIKPPQATPTSATTTTTTTTGGSSRSMIFASSEDVQHQEEKEEEARSAEDSGYNSKNTGDAAGHTDHNVLVEDSDGDGDEDGKEEEQEEEGYDMGIDIESPSSAGIIDIQADSRNQILSLENKGVFLVSNILPCAPVSALVKDHAHASVHTSTTGEEEGSSPFSAVSSASAAAAAVDPRDRYKYAPIGIPIDGNSVYIVRIRPDEPADGDDDENNNDENQEGEESAKINSRRGEHSSSSSTFELVSDGEIGELFIGGAHVAKGYHNRPEETRKRFIRNPFATCTSAPAASGVKEETLTVGGGAVVVELDRGEVVYRTGDIVVRSPSDGALVWIGRRDSQVKIRGVRVELEEVERTIAEAINTTDGFAVIATDIKSPPALSPSSSSSAAAAAANHNSRVGAASGVDLQLVMFIEERVFSSPRPPSLGLQQQLLSPSSSATSSTTSLELRKYLIDRCPLIFVPSLILTVGSLPRNTTGKLDRKKLHRLLDESFTINHNHVNNNEHQGSRSSSSSSSSSAVLRDEDGDQQKAMQTIDSGINDHAIGGFRNDVEIPIDTSIKSVQEYIQQVYKSTIPGLANVQQSSSSSLTCPEVAGGSTDSSRGHQHDDTRTTTTTQEEPVSTTTTLSLSDEAAYRGPPLPQRRQEEPLLLLEYDFFSLGGDSLSAVEVLWSIRRHYRIQLPADQLHLSVKDLAKSICERLERSTSNSSNGNSSRTPMMIEQPGSSGSYRSAGSVATNTLSELSPETELESESQIESLLRGELPAHIAVVAITGATTRKRRNEFLRQTEEGGGREENNKNDLAEGQQVEGDDDSREMPSASSNARTSCRVVRRRLTSSMVVFLDDSATTAGTATGSGNNIAKPLIFSRTSYPAAPGIRYPLEPTTNADTTTKSSSSSVIAAADLEEKAQLTKRSSAADSRTPVSISLKPQWSYKLDRCVDSSPLVIRLPNAKHSSAYLPLTEDSDSNNDHHQMMMVTPATAASKESPVASSLSSLPPETRIKNYTDTAAVAAVAAAGGVLELVFIGSHGGDFVAVDVATGRCVWRCDLCEHIEGGAAAGYAGRTVFVGSFKGSDVDGPPRTTGSAAVAAGSRQRADENDDDADDAAEEETEQDVEEKETTSSSSSLSALGTLWAIRVSDGSVQWKAQVAGEIKSTPVYDHSRKILYVGAYDGYLYAFDAATGAIVHQLDCGGSIYAIPILLIRDDGKSSDQLLVATTRGYLKCIELSATCDTTTTDTSRANSVFSRLSWTYNATSPIFATPTADAHSGRILVAVVDGTVRCLSSTTGEELWRASATKPVFSSPVVLPPSYPPVSLVSDHEGGAAAAAEKSVVFGCHDGILRCVSLHKGGGGESLWETDLGSVLFSSAFIDHRLQTVVIASTAGEIFVVDWATGCVVAKIRIGGEVYSSPVVVGGNIFIGGRDDRLHCIRITAGSTSSY